MSASSDETVKIWCLMDGKAGHQNQVLGCAEAIQRQIRAEIHVVPLSGWNRGAWSIFRVDESRLPTVLPDLLIGAGHASHIPLWRLRQRLGGRSIVLMKPSLPLTFFDYCLIPDVHRLKWIPDNVILTKGVLNRVLPGTGKKPGEGLLLIGGPSAHYQWSEDSILHQVRTILDRQSDIQWTIATSRRTPKTLCDAFLRDAVATLVRPDDVDSDWLPDRLSTAATVWVSEDSVSMTYEALTSGSFVGILELQRHHSNRVTDCIDTLVDSNLVSRWSKWYETGQLPPRIERFCEAERCATELLSRFGRDQITSRAA